jgi:hypothetical protein
MVDTTSPVGPLELFIGMTNNESHPFASVTSTLYNAAQTLETFGVPLPVNGADGAAPVESSVQTYVYGGVPVVGVMLIVPSQAPHVAGVPPMMISIPTGLITATTAVSLQLFMSVTITW